MANTAVRCDSPVQGIVLRIAILDSCGSVVTGTGSGIVVTDGFVQVQDSPQYDTGDRKIQRNAAGVICVNRKMPDQYTNDELTIDFCNWNPGLVVAALGGRLLQATQAPTGTGFALGTWGNADLAHWSLEVWQAPPPDCTSESNLTWPYHAWPHISDGKRGQMTISEDPTILQIIGNTYDASPLWNLGDNYLGTGQVIAGDHYLRNLSNTTPPPAACVLASNP